MALQRDTKLEYVGRWNAGDADHPQGGFKNRTSDGSGDGSYLDEAWANDWDGFFASLLDGVTPNGSVDKVGASQYYDQLVALIAATTALQPGDYIATSDSGVIARGFLLRNGGEADRAVEAGLFAEIGVTFGDGDGVNTFNLPPGPIETPAVMDNTGVFVIPVGSPFTAISNCAVDSNTGDMWVGDQPANMYKSAGGVAAYVATGDYDLVGSYSKGIAVDSFTGDVISGDNNTNMYKLTDGVGSFALLGDFPGDAGGSPVIRGIAVNIITKDVFVADNGNNKIWVLPEGSGTYVEIGDIGASECAYIHDVVVDSNTGDIIVMGTKTTFGVAASVWKMKKGKGTFSEFGDLRGAIATSMALVESSGDLYFGTATEVYKMSFGQGEVFAVGNYPGSLGSGMTGNKVTGDVWITDQASDEVYKLDGVVTNPKIEWYVKT